ncbi:MAG: hypothetical protein AAGM84_08220 [Pseudomonadota bacterium]
MRQLFLLCILWAAPLAADPMSAAEFEAYTTGRTLYFGQNGEAYGAEIYHENRRVTWSFLDGECKDGYWYDDGPLICFVYEDRPEPQCWTFELASGGLIARFENDPGATELYEALDRGDDLLCLGPKVGV